MMPFVLRHGDGVRSRPLPAMDTKNWEPEREQQQQQQQPMKNWEPEREQEQQPMKNWEPEREQGMGLAKWFRDVVGRY